MTRRVALAIVFTLAASALACQRTELPNSWRDLARQTVLLHVDWQQDLSTANPFATYDVELGGVAALDGTVLAATAGVGLVGLNGANGDIVWQRDEPAESYSAAPAAAERFLVPAPDGFVRAFSGGGVLAWETDLGASLHSRPVVAGDRVYVTTAGSDVVALERESGRVAWRYDHPASGQMTLAGDGEVRVEADALYVGFADGSLVKLDRDGAVQWAIDLARGAERLTDVDTRPLVVGDVVVAASFSGGLHGVDAESGAIRWSLDVDGATSPVRAGAYALTTSADARVVWFDPRTGDEVGVLQLDAPSAEAAVLSGDLGLVSTPAGVFVIDAQQPWVYHRFDPGVPVTSLPVVHRDRVYVLSDGGGVYGLSLRRYAR